MAGPSEQSVLRACSGRGTGYQAFIPLGSREKVKFPVASGQPRPGISALRDEEGHRLMPRLGLCRRDTSAASNPTGIWRHGKLSVTTGDGERVSRPLISATDLPLFRSHSLHIPFNDSEKHWVRFSDGDSASNGASTSRLTWSKGLGRLARRFDLRACGMTPEGYHSRYFVESESWSDWTPNSPRW